jgi:hypothetical protein
MESVVLVGGHMSLKINATSKLVAEVRGLGG